MYLKDRERQKIFHVLVHSPRWPQEPGVYQAKEGTRNSIQIYTDSKDPTT